MIAFNGVSKQYGKQVLYKDASFQLNPGEKAGLVGPNGAGKTTVFRVLTGEVGVDKGQVAKPDKIVIGYFSQNIEDMRGRTVLEEVKSAAGNLPRLQRRITEIEGLLATEMGDDEMTKILEEYGELQADFERLGGYDLDARAAEIVTGLGISPDDHHRDTGSFSGGWKMRIALAKI